MAKKKAKAKTIKVKDSKGNVHTVKEGSDAHKKYTTSSTSAKSSNSSSSGLNQSQISSLYNTLQGLSQTLSGFKPGNISPTQKSVLQDISGTLGRIGSSFGGSSGGAPQKQSRLAPEQEEALSAAENYLRELEERGQILNPNIELTPDQLAEFTKQAETEINPYFSTQFKLARESLLKDLGYSRDEILRQEAATEQNFKTGFRTLGEGAADTGFAQSGFRRKQEQELAQDTQKQLDDNRRRLEFNAGNVARAYAQDYGAAELPTQEIDEAPEVTATGGFLRKGNKRALYTLDPSIYQGLTGTQEFNRRAAVKSRAGGLEGAYRSNRALGQLRQLYL